RGSDTRVFIVLYENGRTRLMGDDHATARLVAHRRRRFQISINRVRLKIDVVAGATAEVELARSIALLGSATSLVEVFYVDDRNRAVAEQRIAKQPPQDIRPGSRCIRGGAVADPEIRRRCGRIGVALDARYG